MSRVLGELRNLGNDQCLDALHRGDGERVVLKPCGRGEQRFKLTHYQDLRTEHREKCLDLPSNSDKAPILLYHCHLGKGNQLWRFNQMTKQLLHPVSGKCLDSDSETGEIFGRRCDPAILTQKWKWETLNLEALSKFNNQADL